MYQPLPSTWAAAKRCISRYMCQLPTFLSILFPYNLEKHLLCDSSCSNRKPDQSTEHVCRQWTCSNSQSILQLMQAVDLSNIYSAFCYSVYSYFDQIDSVTESTMKLNYDVRREDLWHAPTLWLVNQLTTFDLWQCCKSQSHISNCWRVLNCLPSSVASHSSLLFSSETIEEANYWLPDTVRIQDADAVETKSFCILVSAN